jgi:hypothetical protein
MTTTRPPLPAPLVSELADALLFMSRAYDEQDWDMLTDWAHELGNLATDAATYILKHSEVEA